ncbi:site-specific recombinase XerD [Pseudonocardia autotrophica]|uniref:Site-specific recombinase XerD n=3 Tax=Pseudonocardiaceae TaxID=2070 RepID=A0A1I5ITZ0_PSUAM|nr:Tyrosine recombinase XerD [Pseudonocardia autotrophica]TDN65614.1 site-specific recombinase XerD [Pseudonocardia autotrophica]BBG05758.1 integrase [Pseudonocardia autotrophica]SFO63830.1 Site-specific recombinase XerD [Pseudonocardia ammonioxydans]
MGLRVQRMASGECARSYTVVDLDGLPVGPVEDFLAHATLVRRLSPNTIAGYAHDLRDYFEWLDQRGLEFARVSLEQLAQFFDWLRRPRQARQEDVFVLPGVPAALAPATLQRKRASVAAFYRFHARRDQAVAPLLGEQIGGRGLGPQVPMLAHLHHGRRGEQGYSPLRVHVPHKPPKTLTELQVNALVQACDWARDRFLIRLLVDSGLRLGEALGLRHADLHLRTGDVEVVPREDNVNHARVKGLKRRRVPVPISLFDLYADYMELEYGPRDCDYVFVNLFAPVVGAPMTAANVYRLVRQLRARTGVDFFTPHVARHTYATTLLRRGVQAHVVTDLLGHADVQTTTAIYSHLRVEDHRALLVAAGALEPSAAAVTTPQDAAEAWVGPGSKE